MISLRRTTTILRKECMHILRDPFTLIFSLIMPLVMVLMFGAAIEFNVRNVPTDYLDQSHSQASRTFLNTLSSSGYFKTHAVESPREGIDRLGREAAKVFVIIPPDFESRLMGRGEGEVQILLDGTDNTAGTALSGYLGTVHAKALKNIFKDASSTATAEPIALKTRFLFNPELNSQWFIVPALAAVIMAILSVLLTTLTIAREWENGSMELLLSTPVRATEVILGKMLPYAFLGLFAIAFLYILARTLYGLPFTGSQLVFWASTFLFLLTYLGQGLLVSTLIHNQQAAVQIALVLGLLPTMLFSGFIFPIEHMPVGFQYLTTIFPARWYVQIARDQFLQGSTWGQLALPFSVLIVYTYVVIQLCVVKFKENLEE